MTLKVAFPGQSGASGTIFNQDSTCTTSESSVAVSIFSYTTCLLTVAAAMYQVCSVSTSDKQPKLPDKSSYTVALPFLVDLTPQEHHLLSVSNIAGLSQLLNWNLRYCRHGWQL